MLDIQGKLYLLIHNPMLSFKTPFCKPLFVFVVALLAQIPLQATTNTEREIQNLQQEIAQKKQQIEAFRKSVKSVRSSRKQALQNYTRSKKRIASLRKKIAAKKTKIASLTSDSKKKTAKIKKLEKLTKKLAQGQIRNIQFIQLIKNQPDFGRFIDLNLNHKIEHISYFLQHQYKKIFLKIDEILERRIQLTQETNKLKQLIDSIKQENQALGLNEQRLAQEIALNALAVEQLKTKESSLLSSLQASEDEFTSLYKRLEKLNRQLNSNNFEFQQNKGLLPTPVDSKVVFHYGDQIEKGALPLVGLCLA